jgi:uncharacterized protein YbaP (TraB family)
MKNPNTIAKITSEKIGAIKSPNIEQKIATNSENPIYLAGSIF